MLLEFFLRNCGGSWKNGTDCIAKSIIVTMQPRMIAPDGNMK